MHSVWNKSAALLALIIGAMAIVSGGQVLMGKDPGYYVIDWLPVYNFTIGVISVLITAVLLWKNSSYAVYAAVGTITLHAIVAAILLTSYGDVVAVDSLRAMTIRLTTWVIILALVFVGRRRSRAATA